MRADTNYVVPSGGGTITSFSYHGGIVSGGQLEFLVLRKAPLGDFNYQVVGKTGLVTPTGTGQQTFPADIPVQSGDILGNWSSRSLVGCRHGSNGTGGYANSGFTFPRPSVADPIYLQMPGGFSDLNESANLVPTTAPNVAPVAQDDGPYSHYGADTPLVLSAQDGVLSNDIDADNDALTAAKVSDPSHGSVTLDADGSFSYSSSETPAST